MAGRLIRGPGADQASGRSRRRVSGGFQRDTSRGLRGHHPEGQERPLLITDSGPSTAPSQVGKLGPRAKGRLWTTSTHEPSLASLLGALPCPPGRRRAGLGPLGRRRRATVRADPAAVPSRPPPQLRHAFAALPPRRRNSWQPAAPPPLKPPNPAQSPYFRSAGQSPPSPTRFRPAGKTRPACYVLAPFNQSPPSAPRTRTACRAEASCDSPPTRILCSLWFASDLTLGPRLCPNTQPSPHTDIHRRPDLILTLAPPVPLRWCWLAR